MYKPKNHKERVSHRLKIAKGHLEKVIAMVNDNAYCIDVLHQSQAIQKALKEIDNLILEHHLATCAVKAIKEGKHSQAIEEVMNVFKRKGV